ncbi:D-glycerate dehydrogenase [Bacillaceae bacterium SIJ1]|uniref:2-hydroxyacid dehydrogenase n=1 Tax=Litoribacterium kuwaitense TaxID=1398745 RepID=UPI0013ED8D15|nr:D-glycerate dehydrogenase [Litoribacterium kuwaitense]NGP46500.1 D-glycerate dehydrogenase [Litoribacterium kuwaitense]
MKPRVYVTRKLPDDVIERLAQTCHVRMWESEEEAVPRDVFIEELKAADGALTMLTEQIDRSVLEAAPNLRVISQMAVGYNNIDLATATARKVAVVNTPGVLTETTADLTFALLMAVARRIPEAERFVKEGKWKTWAPLLLTGADVHGATLGILGLGRIGEAVAKRARGFDMTVHYYSRTRKPDVEEKLGVQYRSFDEVIATSDFLCVLMPYTKETYQLIGREAFAKMKPSCRLINTGRGEIVDEEALYDALVQGEIAGAGLDVFTEEPISTDHPLLQLPQVVALPHIGSASVATRMTMAHMAVDHLVAALQGKAPKAQLNPEVLTS